MRPMAHGNPRMKNDRNGPGRVLELCIAQAREIAAGGDMTYTAALEHVAFEHGMSDWRTLEAVMKEERGATRMNPLAYLIAHTSISILAPKPERRIHVRDRLARGITRMITLPFTTMGVPMRVLEASTAIAAALSTFGCIPLAYAIWRDDKGFYMNPGIIAIGMVMSTVVSIWLATRWLIMSGDPLHPVASSIRAWAVHAAAIGTVFGTMPGMMISRWLSPSMTETTVALMSLLASPLWIAAMQTGTLRAEEEATDGNA
jgi:hypothetical protein